MSHVLILIILGGGERPSVISQNFKTEIGCLQAIEKSINFEKKPGINAVHAFCVKD